MNDMVRHNPDTGQNYIYDPVSSVWSEVSASDAQAATRGFVENTAREIGSNVVDAAGMVVDGINPFSAIENMIPGHPGSIGTQMQRSNDEAQQGRWNQEGMSVVGGAILDPTNFIPAAGGARVAKAGASAAARRSGLSIPFRRTQGGVANGMDVVTASRARAAEGVADGTMGAARNTSDVAYQGEKMLLGLNDPERVRDMARGVGMDADNVLTRGDTAALGARNADEIGAADAIREREELFTSSLTNDVIAGRRGGNTSISDVRKNQRELLGRRINQELGLNTDARLTDTTLIRAREQIGAQFDEAAEAAGPLQFQADDMKRLDQAVVDGGAEARTSLESTVQNLKDDIQNGTLDPKRAAAARSKLGKEAVKPGVVNTPKGDALNDIKEVLDDIVDRQIPQEVAETLADARYKYRVLLAAEKSTATSAGGEINARAFKNALQRGINSQGRSMRRTERGAQFSEDLETMGYLMEKVKPDSGTAGRIIANLPKAGGAAGVLSAGQALFGD